MLLLTSTSDIVRVVTGSAGDIRVHASWMDNLSAVITPGRTNTASISTATTTTVVGSPAASTQRNVKLLNIFNNSGSVANQITVEHTDGTNVVQLWKGTLAIGESVDMDQEGGWNYYSAAGILIQTLQPTPKIVGSSAANQTGFAADTYLTGSRLLFPPGGPLAGAQYRCIFDMVKTAAGVATPIITVRVGTAGTTADTSRAAMTFAVGTAVVDSGIFEVLVHFRTIGSGAAAVLAAVTSLRHALAATGLTTTGASGHGQIANVGGGFDSTAVNLGIGVSFNGGTSFSGTCTLIQAQLLGAV